MTLAYILAVANVVLALILIVVSIGIVKRNNIRHRWMRVLWMLSGVYWLGVYLYVLFGDPAIYQSAFFSQTFIRPGITFLLAMATAGAVVKRKI